MFMFHSNETPLVSCLVPYTPMSQSVWNIKDRIMWILQTTARSKIRTLPEFRNNVMIHLSCLNYVKMTPNPMSQALADHRKLPTLHLRWWTHKLIPSLMLKTESEQCSQSSFSWYVSSRYQAFSPGLSRQLGFQWSENPASFLRFMFHKCEMTELRDLGDRQRYSPFYY